MGKGLKELMFVDKESKKTILHKVCYLGHSELLKFLESLMDQKQFIQHIFLGDETRFNYIPIEYAIKKSQASIAKYLFDMEEVQDRYKDNDPMIFKLLILLFAKNSNPNITDYVLSALDISKEKVIEMLSYTCPYVKVVGSYFYFKIMTSIIWDGTFNNFQHLIDFVGEQALVVNIFNIDGYGRDVMRWAFFRKKMNVIECVLSFVQIKEKYMSDNNLLHYLCGTLNECIEYKEAVKYVVDTLGLTEAKLSELNEFRAIDIEKIIPFTK